MHKRNGHGIQGQFPGAGQRSVSGTGPSKTRRLEVAESQNLEEKITSFAKKAFSTGAGLIFTCQGTLSGVTHGRMWDESAQRHYRKYLIVWIASKEGQKEGRCEIQTAPSRAWRVLWQRCPRDGNGRKKKRAKEDYKRTEITLTIRSYQGLEEVGRN